MRSEEYKAWIRTQGCVVCISVLLANGISYVKRRESECAHVGNRGLGQKSSDRETLPLCKEHHTEGKLAHHKLGKRFWGVHGLDKDALIAWYNAKFERDKCRNSKTLALREQ